MWQPSSADDVPGPSLRASARRDARGEAFGRAQAPAGRDTRSRVYRRMFGELDGTERARRADDLPADQEIEGIAAGAGVDAHELRAVNARTEILAGERRTECSVAGGGGCSRRTGTGIRTLAESTLVWIVEHERGWFATLTEAGILAKIGLNDAGLGVCLNLLQYDRRRRRWTARRSTSCCGGAGDVRDGRRGARAADAAPASSASAPP